jgi:hypothetical protein
MKRTPAEVSPVIVCRSNNVYCIFVVLLCCRNMKSLIRYVIILFIVGLFVFTGSCRKDLGACRGNCAGIHFSGIVYDKTTGQALANQHIAVNLYRSAYCIGCTVYKVAAGTTGANGHFIFDTKFDSTLMRDYYLSVNIPAPENYILNAEPVGPGIQSYAVTANTRFYNLDSTVAMANINAGFYPKTLLHINLHRTATNVPLNPYLTLDFTFDQQRSGWGILESNSNKDTTLTINTAANIFTKITASSLISPSNVISVIDSIKCMKNANNAIDIYY